MKARLTVAAVNASRRGRHALAVGWVHWFPRFRTVPESQFQGPDEPFPAHWRIPPEPWPGDGVASPRGRVALERALAELPDAWRSVVWARDVQRRPAVEVAQQLGLSVEAEQHLLSCARGALRQRVAELLDPADRS
jgi:RNA polymerase sigma-70 factor (ECF subfamily)